ncbi:MAG: hypothetical protein OIF35_09180 [Cellvibrionaceae bacterium]|nr:hypothetical protein [Cellvibrionaceae bacterium]
MYIFSATAKTQLDRPGFKAGSSVPFIVYIDFKDMFGAEKLCQLFLLKEGFSEVHIEKRKLIPNDKLSPELIDKDPAIAEALASGYMIQMFDAH